MMVWFMLLPCSPAMNGGACSREWDPHGSVRSESVYVTS